MQSRRPFPSSPIGSMFGRHGGSTIPTIAIR